MDIVDGLIMYLGLLVLLTFHEFGHAWVASHCGDDTARLQGRCSLNPLVHIDLIGTVLIPLWMIFVPSSFGIIGWAKPVPVNPYNLQHPRRDDILVSMAGPGMNLLLAIGLIALARVSLLVDAAGLTELLVQLASLSLLLCFFNLIPVPPLDGSHVLRQVTNMSDETYWKFSQFGFIIVIVLINLRPVQQLLMQVTSGALRLLAAGFGLPLV